jgi:hypothetical protein
MLASAAALQRRCSPSQLQHLFGDCTLPVAAAVIAAAAAAAVALCMLAGAPTQDVAAAAATPATHLEVNLLHSALLTAAAAHCLLLHCWQWWLHLLQWLHGQLQAIEALCPTSRFLLGPATCIAVQHNAVHHNQS